MSFNPAKAGFSFFAHARSGIVGGLTDPFSETLTQRPKLKLQLDLDQGEAVERDVSLLGPGDVLAIDPAEIVRSDPPPGTLDWTPNWFPLVELDRPDLPWLFAPYGVTANRLRPWLVLVVVELRDGVEYLEVHPSSGRPALTVSGPATGTPARTLPDRELPDLDGAWAWAHVAVAGNLGAADIGDENRDHPERVVSRIVGPRRLHANRHYRACLVPAFAAGADAGLETPSVSSTLEPAWTTGDETVELPVYHSWEFGTGPEGDFAALARRLHPMRSPPGVGARPIDARRPGGGLPDAGSAVGGLQGALQPPGTDLGPGPGSEFLSALRAQLDSTEPQAGAPPRPLEMPPPLYGRWPAGRTTVPQTSSRRGLPWLAELNLDPRHRAAAALGAAVVRRDQEALMAGAWAQVGPIDRANEALRQAQLAREAATAAHARLAGLDAMALISLTSPALSRIKTTTGGETVHKAVSVTRAAPAMSSAVRRALRPRGPLARRADPRGRLRGALARLNSDATSALPERQPPAGTHMADWVAGTDERAVLDGNPGAFDPRDDGVSPRSGVELQGAAAVHQRYLEGWAGHPDPVRPTLDVRAARAQVLVELRPELVLTARVGRRVQLPSGFGGTRDDPLESVMDAPEFETPMWEALRSLGQDYVLPGIDALPQDSITVLAANDRFVNSFMIGLSHEMARELLWREYPTDQRATYFRVFWDSSARLHTSGQAAEPDLEPLHEWPVDRSLDHTSSPAGPGRLVLLVRGQLLRRFPNATLSAVEATPGSPRGLGTTQIFPVFAGRLDPDLTFVGFELDEESARAGGSQGEGWFFVLQEHPTEPHLGLEEAVPGTANVPGGKPGSWDELSWAHLVGTQTELDDLSYAPATPPTSATPSTPPASGDPVWGTHSADITAIALRKPVRLAIHATDLLPDA